MNTKQAKQKSKDSKLDQLEHDAILAMRDTSSFYPDAKDRLSKIKNYLIAAVEHHFDTKAIVLIGWKCTHCQVFNGESKEPLTHCRACGQSKDA